VVGFRHLHSLAAGHHGYVEDVIALPEARKGAYAQASLEWVVEGRAAPRLRARWS